MSGSAANPKVDWYFDNDSQWQAEFRELRSLLLGRGLAEELKWGHPCYTLGGKNVVLMHGFKAYCALLFMKGALMDDPDHILVQQTANVQSARQIRFTGLEQLRSMAAAVSRYVAEAVRVEQSGLEVPFKDVAQYRVPEEFSRRLSADATLKDAFEALTPGRQRAYLLHFSSAKQSKTREARIDRCVDRIKAGLGLD